MSTPAVPPVLHPISVDHVGIAVAEIEAAVQRWTTLLGFVATHREENAEQGVVEVMLDPPGPPRRTGPAPTRLQILAPLTPESPIARFLQRSGPGLQHLAVTVEDVAASAERLRTAGLRVLYPEPRPGTAGSRINFVHPKDVGGVLLELVEHRPG